MSSAERSPSASPARAPATAAPDASGAPVQHPHTFKLRFAPQRVPGRSYQSAIRPLKLPAVVTDKFWRRLDGEETAEAEARALRTVRDMFALGPRDKHDRPEQSSHEYGWWHDAGPRLWAAPRGDRRLQHHIRDSAWLKARLRVLAEAAPAEPAPAAARRR